MLIHVSVPGRRALLLLPLSLLPSVYNISSVSPAGKGRKRKLFPFFSPTVLVGTAVQVFGSGGKS